MLRELQANKPPEFTFDLAAAVDAKFRGREDTYAIAIQRVKEKYATARQQLDDEHAEAVRLSEAAANATNEPILQRYDKLLSYRDAVAEAVLHYDIKPSDLDIDLDNLSNQEVIELLDGAIEACENLGTPKDKKSLASYIDPEELGDQKLAWLLILAVGFVALSPFILLAMFVYTGMRTRKAYRSLEPLRVATKLMHNVDFSRYRVAPEPEPVPDVDYSEIDAAEKADLERFAEKDPSLDRHAYQQKLNQEHSEIAADFRIASNAVLKRYDGYLNLYAASIKHIQEMLDDYISKQAPFGTACSKSLVMDTNFVLGRAKNVADVKYDIGLRNIVFANRSTEMLQFVKLMMGNALLSVLPKQLRFTVYDPSGLGADFATYLTQETADYVNVATDNLSKILSEHRAYAQTNLRTLDTKDINTYNREAEEKDMVPLEYRILLIVSGADSEQDRSILQEFMQFSGRTGAFVWYVNPNPIAQCAFYSKPFDGIDEPYPLTPELFNRIAGTYLEEFKERADKGILYKEAFADKYLPKESWWQENTDKGIKLNMGLQDGDPTKGYALELGDANVHGLAVGATGAGKSVFVNQLLTSLMIRYAPSSLELILVDLKNVEFAALTDPKTHISRIPHARIISGTKDGAYAISIFDYLMSEMDRRTKLFAAAGVEKLEDYNRLLRNSDRVAECLPRILVLIDEFQVMFTELPPKLVEIIQARIRSLSKLARFCGCHLLFVSQSMKGTIPKDILDQFSLRIALRCSADTSRDILGAPVASQVKSKFGYLYTNTNAGETQDSTRLWRTPFLSKDVLRSYMDEVEKLCEERGERHHRALFYDENERYSSSSLMEWQDAHTDIVQAEKRLFLLGERTSFSLKKAPINFKLFRSDGENILFYAFEPADFRNLCMTLIDNIRRVPDATLLINTADPDLFTVLDLESWYTPAYLDLARPTQDASDWLDFLQGIIDKRKGLPPDAYGPMYFMALRWDKQLGIGRDMNWKLEPMWNKILAEAPAVDLHIVVGTQTHKSDILRTLTPYNHLIAAKAPAEDASFKFMEDKQLATLPSELGFAIYKYGSDTQKFKVYQYQFTREVEARALAI